MGPLHSLWVLLFVGALAISVMADLHGEFARPAEIPLERVIRSLRAQLKGNENDHWKQYQLARSYYLAFSVGSKVIPGEPEQLEPDDWYHTKNWLSVLRSEEANRRTFDALEKDGIEHETSVEWLEEYGKRYRPILKKLEKDEWIPDPVTNAEALEYAHASWKLFKQSLAQQPDRPLYLLGKASLAEELLVFRSKLKKAPKWLEALSEDTALELYYRAFSEAIKADAKLKQIPITGLESLVSYEAATKFLSLSDAEDETDTERREQAEQGVARICKIPQVMITPLAIALAGEKRAADLLSDSHRVRFDMDRDGNMDDVQWFSSRAGILVWDAATSGQVRDGAQLFGSVTFGLFHRNGFEALALLDDDQNGTLSGTELVGLSIWVDANRDGVAGEGEVQPFLEAGGASLRVGPVERESGGHLVVNNGARVRDKWEPVFDLMLDFVPAHRDSPTLP